MTAIKIDDCDRRVLSFLASLTEGGGWVSANAIPLRLFNATPDENVASLPNRGLIENHPTDNRLVRITETGRRALCEEARP